MSVMVNKHGKKPWLWVPAVPLTECVAWGGDVTTSLKVDFCVSEAGMELWQGLRKIEETLDKGCFLRSCPQTLEKWILPFAVVASQQKSAGIDGKRKLLSLGVSPQGTQEKMVQKNPKDI